MAMLDWFKSRLGNPERRRRTLLQRADDAYERGASDEARQCCVEVLRMAPNDLAALSLLAAIAADAKQIEEGLRWAQRAIAADAQAVSPHYAMGRLQEAAGRLAEAEASYRMVVSLDPSHARAHNNLGCVLHMQGKLDAALACYRRALEIDPALPEANQNYASIVRDVGAQELAVQGYVRQTAANPNDAAAWCNLGNTCAELGRHDQALASFERALAVNPEFAEAHFSRSLVLLLRGDYARGWKEYEWRWRIHAFNAPARRFPQPVWDGSRIDGETVLIHAEQGFGDTLQFVRYAPLVAQRCASVIIECPPELKSLLQGVAGAERVVARGEALPPFAAHVPLMSLPGIFGTTLDSIPWSGPYIHADPKRAAQWRADVDAVAAGRFKVGLVWAGNPRQWNDRNRSATLAALAPLAGNRGTVFFSLQIGKAAEQAGAPPAGMTLVDFAARIRDFSDSAALLSHLDLVISVDTATAHLAAAMGVPTWVLLAQAADWRYHLGRDDNPWYPTMRLFRQEREGDWTAPVERLAQALRQRIEE